MQAEPVPVLTTGMPGDLVPAGYVDPPGPAEPRGECLGVLSHH